jgi:hypothetical protein
MRRGEMILDDVDEVQEEVAIILDIVNCTPRRMCDATPITQVGGFELSHPSAESRDLQNEQVKMIKTFMLLCQKKQSAVYLMILSGV